MKILRMNLSVLRLWPYEALGDKSMKHLFFWRVYTFMTEVFCVTSNSLYMKANQNKISFFEMGHTYITFLLNIAAGSRAMLPFFKGYHTLVKEFVLSVHLFNHKNKSKYAMEIHLFIHKLSHFFVMYITGMMFFGLVLFNVTPFLNTMASGAFNTKDRPENVTYEPAVYHALPFDYIHDFKGYCFVFILNWYLGYICSALICLIDVFIFVMVFHVWGHMKLLIHNIKDIPKPGYKDANNINSHESTSVNSITYDNDGAEKMVTDSRMFSKEEMVEIFGLLRDNILHHIYISKFSKRMSTIFGPIILVYHSFHLVSGCLLLLEVSQLDPKALGRYGPLTIIIFQQLIQISLIFELLGSMSDKFNEALYMVPWECMDIPARRLYMVFLRQSQVSTSLKAGGMVEVGVRTMASILKTTISYFTLLITIAK